MGSHGKCRFNLAEKYFARERPKLFGPKNTFRNILFLLDTCRISLSKIIFFSV